MLKKRKRKCQVTKKGRWQSFSGRVNLPVLTFTIINVVINNSKFRCVSLERAPKALNPSTVFQITFCSYFSSTYRSYFAVSVSTMFCYFAGNPKSRNPKTGIRKPETGIRNPESGIRNPESRMMTEKFSLAMSNK